ncbi:MAG: peptidoglycan DD-metalloendopeptidase family protein [Chthonomonadales bacterium]
MTRWLAFRPCVGMLLALILAALGSAGFAQAPVQGDRATRALEMGRRIDGFCVNGDGPGLYRLFNQQMRQAVPEERITQILKDILAYASIGPRIRDEVSRYQDFDVYVSLHSWGDRQLQIQASFDEEGRIAGLFLRPAGALPPDPKAGYRTKSRLQLPFRGSWYVFWGGDTIQQNYHVNARDQRHAYDFLIVKQGSTHRGDGKRNSDYYAWGQPVLAPAPGTVILSVDGVPDNTPGVMNPQQLYGNHVVLDLGNSEYAVLCHFRNGSIRVHAGQRVRMGQVLGLCGNSGNSSEPHIHFHLQDRAKLGAGAIGLPALFVRYVASGRKVQQGTPVRGQVVANAVSIPAPIKRRLGPAPRRSLRK